MLYNDNVVCSPNIGPLLAAPLFSCIASHQAHGLHNHRDGTQATTEGSEILARDLIVLVRHTVANSYLNGLRALRRTPKSPFVSAEQVIDVREPLR